MREALAPLPRFLATARVTKHRLFTWLEAPTLPDSQVFAFAFDDDFSLGVLHSRIHEAWARAQGTQVRERESGFRYTPTSCFENFPFPFADDLANERDDPLQTVAKFRATHYHTDQSNVLREDAPPTSPAEHREAIASAARELNEMRESWLNPPEWTAPRTLTFPGALDGPWRRLCAMPTRTASAPFTIRSRNRATPSAPPSSPSWMPPSPPPTAGPPISATMKSFPVCSRSITSAPPPSKPPRQKLARRNTPSARRAKTRCCDAARFPCQATAMKSNLTKRRYKAQKRSACPMCKPHKRGWEDKKTTGDLRSAVRHEQELLDTVTQFACGQNRSRD